MENRLPSTHTTTRKTAPIAARETFILARSYGRHRYSKFKPRGSLGHSLCTLSNTVLARALGAWRRGMRTDRAAKGETTSSTATCTFRRIKIALQSSRCGGHPAAPRILATRVRSSSTSVFHHPVKCMYPCDPYCLSCCPTQESERLRKLKENKLPANLSELADKGMGK